MAYRIQIQESTGEVVKSVQSEMSNLTKLKQFEFNSIITKLKQSTIFLAHIPPITGIVRATQNKGIDPIYGESLALWKNRLQDIYQNYLLSEPAYFQARFIGIKNQGLELVRVERLAGETAVTVAAEQDLQPKGQRDYFIKGMALAPEVVGFSEINLNQEHGHIETPLRPTLRVFTPIGDPSGKPFGLVIINYDLSNFLADFSRSLPKGIGIYLTNSKNQLLLSPKAGQAFLHEFDAQAKNWPELFQASVTDFNPSELPIYRNTETQEDSVIFSTQIKHPLLSAEQYYMLHITLPVSVVKSQIMQHAMPKLTLMGLSLSLIALMTMLLAIILNKRHMQNISQLNAELENQVKIRTAALNESLHEKALLLEAIQQQLLYTKTSADGLITEANDLFCSVSGYNRDEIIDRTHHILTSEKHDTAFWKAFWQTVKSGRPWRGVICNRHKNGKLYYVDTVVIPVPDETGNIKHYISLRIDITETISAEKQLKIAKNDAERANLAKSQFLAAMSHEIRTPLNVIIGTIYLLRLSSLTQAQKDDVQTIDIASKNLLTLINDILDFSKIEANELILDPQLFSLTDVMDDLRQMFTVVAANKGLRLSIPKPDDSLPKTLRADGNRLRQILINLLNNAIKFTAQGYIGLTVGPAKNCQTDNFLCLRFTVTDTGIGISAETQAKLFQPFIQADTSTSREYGGTGLGLSIVKRLSELMGGRVGIDSKLGQGSNFWVELPFEVSNTPLNQHKQPIALHPLHVLIAEDDKNDRNALLRLCENFGWQTETTADGEQAIEWVIDHLEHQQPIDCLILDWHMPKLDGLAVLSELEKRIGAARIPSVIMITADDRDKLVRAINGIRPDSILTKPTEQSMLFNMVNQAVASQTNDLSHVLNGSIVIGKHIQWLTGLSILVVDDSQMNLNVIRRMLVNEGADVTECLSGNEAILRLENNPKGYQLILMDLQMPEKDGCETTLEIRKRLGIQQLPIVALTAGATTSERERAYAAGMNDFLSKPVEPVALIRIIRQHVENYSTQIISVRPKHSDHEATRQNLQQSAINNTWPEIAGIDSKKAALLLSGDAAFFLELLNMFITEHETTSTTLQTLIENGELSKASALAHKIKGQAANLGATALSQAAAELEASTREHHPVEQRLLHTIAHEFSKLRKALG